eukprot:5154461-Amphidinium_carterae.1
MPVALATATSGANWKLVGNTYRGPHYWYEPDDTFLVNVPQRIQMPAYNAEEHAMGIRSTEQPQGPLHKWVWNQLVDIAPRVHTFVSLL